MSEEELYKLLNIPYKPWIELTNEEIQLFEKNNNYIKQLQQENVQLKQQLKDIEEYLESIKDMPDADMYIKLGEYKEFKHILEILESNKED